MRRLVRRVEVDGDAKRHPDLVRPGVTPADGSRSVVHFVRHAVFSHRLSLKEKEDNNEYLQFEVLENLLIGFLAAS